jgi:hypothetical protein
MEWKKVKLPNGAKLFKVHNFNFLHSGVNYNLEVDEYADGTFTGHGEHATDKNNMVESVSGKTINGCLEALIQRIQTRP